MSAEEKSWGTCPICTEELSGEMTLLMAIGEVHPTKKDKTILIHQKCKQKYMRQFVSRRRRG